MGTESISSKWLHSVSLLWFASNSHLIFFLPTCTLSSAVPPALISKPKHPGQAESIHWQDSRKASRTDNSDVFEAAPATCAGCMRTETMVFKISPAMSSFARQSPTVRDISFTSPVSPLPAH